MPTFKKQHSVKSQRGQKRTAQETSLLPSQTVIPSHPRTIQRSVSRSRSKAKRSFPYAKPDPFFATHDWETALQGTITPPSPISRYSLNNWSIRRPRQQNAQSNVMSKLNHEAYIEIYTDPLNDKPVPRFRFTRPRLPLVPIYTDTDDGLRALRPARRLTQAQEEMRWRARRAQAAVDIVELPGDENDDKDWNKENEYAGPQRLVG
ncbi:hypothetical protein GLAREA_03763 [Glarea lozoyensis ATCC 20868]|uniref:Uncharacterized protein n=1 Tax=Glarea lozoyensis (strain ATCC 20868 / MF5171) TaxID=1116229 RepID=S3DFS1_GLAL2|nr:uncharacterized protein GLAREA_03763 [Glarea lozoyensis ATCC 20868]EPE30796.1 hypothetical protein GLAREA_03763 [Glarea lozoyensis ATCC 20868]